MARVYNAAKLKDVVTVGELPIAGQVQAGFLKTTWLNALRGIAPTIAVECQNLLSLDSSFYSDSAKGDVVQSSNFDGKSVYVLASDWDKTFSPLLKKIDGVLCTEARLHLVKVDESRIFGDALQDVCDADLSFGTMNNYNSTGRAIYLRVLKNACKQDGSEAITLNQKSYKLMSESAIHILFDYVQELKGRFEKGEGTEAERQEFGPVLDRFHTGMIAPLVKKETTGSLLADLREPTLQGYI